MILYSGNSLAFIVYAPDNLKQRKSILRLQLLIPKNAATHGQILVPHVISLQSHFYHGSL